MEEFLDVDPALALVHGRGVAGSLENDRTANDRAQPDAHDHGYGGHRPFIRIIHYRVHFHGDQDAAEEEHPCSPHAPTQAPALSAKTSTQVDLPLAETLLLASGFCNTKTAIF